MVRLDSANLGLNGATVGTGGGDVQARRRHRLVRFRVGFRARDTTWSMPTPL